MLKIDKLQLDLIINGDASRLQLARLRTEAAELRKEIKGIKDQTLLGTKKAELANLDDSIEKIIHQIGITGLSMKELASRAGTLKMAINQMAPDNALLKPYQKELKEVQTRYEELRDAGKASKGMFGNAGILGEMLGVAGGIGIEQLASKGFEVVKSLVVGAVESSKSSADRWNTMVSGMKFGYNEFLKTIASGDWSNFFANIGNAITAGQKFEETMINLKMRASAQSILSAEAKEKFTGLWDKFNDATLKTEERIKAAQEGIAIESKATQDRIKNDNIALDAQVKKLEVITKLGEGTIKKYVKDYQSNQALIDQTRDYIGLLKTQKEVEGLDSRDETKIPRLADLRQLIAEIPQAAKNYKGVVEGMEKLNDGEYKDFVDTWVKKIQTQTDFNVEIRRLTKDLGGVQKKQIDQEKKDYEDKMAKFKKLQEDYNELIKDSGKIAKTNFADKLSQTESEIKLVNEKYNNEIEKLNEFKTKYSSELTPQNKKGIDQQSEGLAIARDAQVKQVLVQAEQTFAEQVKQIHQNLKVARMAITERQVYETNKKYDDAEKEILDAIAYRYNEELKLAGTNTAKIQQAEQNKADAIEAIQKDIDSLEVERKKELKKARLDAEQKFQDDLKAMDLKAEQDIAKGEEKIQLEINRKYKKLLDENFRNEKRLEEIKAQMKQEYADRVADYQEKVWQKQVKDFEAYLSKIMQGVSAIEGAWAASENNNLKKDEASNNQKKVNLKKQLDAKIISQKQYDDKSAKLDADLDTKKKETAHKQAVRQKEIAVFNATIALLQAIIQAANIAPPADIVMPIIIAALMGVQLAALIATPVPAAAKGRYQVLQAAMGRYDVIGQSDKKAYKGVPFVKNFDGTSDGPMLTNETGKEIVINPEHTRNLMMNYPLIVDAIRSTAPQKAMGAYPDSVFRSGVPGGQSGLSIGMDPRFITALETLSSHIENGIHANVVYDDYQKAQNKIAVIENDVKR